jgi:hypothetical protein
MPIFDVALSTGEILKIDAPDENAARNEAERYLLSGQQPLSQPQETRQAQQMLPDIGGVEALKEGLLNLPSSTVRLAGETAQAILNPIETAKSIKDLGLGVLQIATPEFIKEYDILPDDPEAEEIARQVGQYYKDRYGSIDSVKRAFAEDPAFVLADLSTVFGIGAATTPGKISSALRAAEKATNPIVQTAKVAKIPGRVGAELLGQTTGAGSRPIIEAFNAAVAGGEKSKEFLRQMRNNENLPELVNAADLSLKDMTNVMQNEYRSLKTVISKDNTILDISPIQKKISEQLDSLVTSKGDIVDPDAVNALNSAKDIIDNWQDLTPIGLDGLKRRIYTLAPPDKPNTYRVVKSLYDETKETIIKQAPEYAEMMKKFSEAAELIDEIKRTLSIDSKATVDTKVRKLLSSMRDNVNAAYGRRAQLVSELEKATGRQIISGLAGASLEPLTPRGLSRLPTTAGAGFLAFGEPATTALLSLGATSPRLVGEAAYGAGLLGRYLTNPELLNTLYQAQQTQNIEQQQ